MIRHIYKNEYKYPNLSLFFAILFFTYILSREGILSQWVRSAESLGYLRIFLTGMFFVSTFTVAPATAILFLMLSKFNILEIALVGGIGSVFGDYIIFKFVKEDLIAELKDIFARVAGDSILQAHWIVHTKYFGWLGPVIGALIIASPLPDELGIGLLGIYKMDNKKFILLTWILNTAGLFFILGAINIFR